MGRNLQRTFQNFDKLYLDILDHERPSSKPKMQSIPLRFIALLLFYWQIIIVRYIHSSPKVMAVFLFLIFENFLIGGMFSILETIKSDRSTLILQNKSWCQMINPMCTTFQMWQNCILQNQVCFERLISLSKTPYIFVKISKPRNWDPYSISAMSHGNRTSSYETVAHKLRPSVAFDWQYTPRQKLWPFSSNIKMNMLDLLNFYNI